MRNVCRIRRPREGAGDGAAILCFQGQSFSGQLLTKEFALLWSAFCEQYRLGPKETFVQYPYAKSVIKSAVGAGGYYSFRHLFREVKAGNTGGHLVGVQSSYWVRGQS